MPGGPFHICRAIIGERPDDAEADEEGDDERRRSYLEFLDADERHAHALDPDNAADEGVDQY